MSVDCKKTRRSIKVLCKCPSLIYYSYFLLVETVSRDTKEIQRHPCNTGQDRGGGQRKDSEFNILV